MQLPIGGGSIQGMGEKFSVAAVTGTCSASVPVRTSRARSDFGPQLSLAYDSGAGNGPFGMGWHLGPLGPISRKTDKGRPQYRDADDSDVFLLPGSEDLVPVLSASGSDGSGSWTSQPPAPRSWNGATYTIRLYLPRVQSSFSRVERWTDTANGSTHWRVLSASNVTTVYGADNNSRIYDPHDSNPEHPSRIFSWLPCQAFDDCGNCLVYSYKAEDSSGVSLQPNEIHRTPLSRSANRYLKRVQYGNIQPPLQAEGHISTANTQWMFEVVLDYGEHDPVVPTPTEVSPWLCRLDPFSSYRSCFEVRSYRLCQRVLMFHQFPLEQAIGADCLVSSLDFEYAQDPRLGAPLASFVGAITQRSYLRSGSAYQSQFMPPLVFQYSVPTVNAEVVDVVDHDSFHLQNGPNGLMGGTTRWVDLYGDGLSGILTETVDAWYYKANLGGARFAPMQLIRRKPPEASITQLMDVDQNGCLDLIDLDGPVKGFFPGATEGGWHSFRPFRSMPNISWVNPNLRFIDITGDGLADVLITQGDEMVWYPSMGAEGFGRASAEFIASDEERSPRVLFSDGTHSVYLADMSGDGLADLVRVYNGEVAYWPNLGYGRFGEKVVMDNSPQFDTPDKFRQSRVRLADIDGNGACDLVYLADTGVQLFFNHCGNGWTDAQYLPLTPAIDDISEVEVIDLLGNGTACLAWSSPLPANQRRQARYVDLMGGVKPNMLLSMVNNVRVETRIHYSSSTQFFLQEQAKGVPSICHLPFPVQVVTRVERCDRVSNNRFVSRYAYHHGYYDGVEREFNGFGLVEQWDTEDVFALTSAAAAGASAAASLPSNADVASTIPPVWTRSWFHTGAYIAGASISRQMEEEYWREPAMSGASPQPAQLQLPDSALPTAIRLVTGQDVPYDLSPWEVREASRALKGSLLRKEVFAQDGGPQQPLPYSVQESNYSVLMCQPRGANRHAVFFTFQQQSLDCEYERRLYVVPLAESVNAVPDPRVTHALTLAVDGYGIVTQSATVNYGRRYLDSCAQMTADDHDQQTRNRFRYTQSSLTNAVEFDDSHRLPAPAEVQTFELVHVSPSVNPTGQTALLSLSSLSAQIGAAADGAHDLLYDDVNATQATDPTHPYRRLMDWQRRVYRSDDLSGPLSLGEMQPLGLMYESYTFAFSAAAAVSHFVQPGQRFSSTSQLTAALSNEAGYVPYAGDSNWWIPSGRWFYSPNSADAAAQELAYAQQHFFLPLRYRDPFYSVTLSTEAFVQYDAYDLLLLEQRDSLGNRTTVGERNADPTLPLVMTGQDYRLLLPCLVMDPNRNRQGVQFDIRGMVVGTATMGKPGEQVGDDFSSFQPLLSDADISAYFAKPTFNPQALLGTATSRCIYDVFAYFNTQDEPQPQPVVASTLMRQTHNLPLVTAAAAASPMPLVIQQSLIYSDGFGQLIQTKSLTEPGPVPKRDPSDGAIDISPVDGLPILTTESVDPRWRCSGWTVLNNKGLPVRQFEPFFTDRSLFESDVRIGVSPIFLYDALGRKVAVSNPDHSWTKTVFDSWGQQLWDTGDTALLDPSADADVGPLFARISTTEYTPSWYMQRSSAPVGSPQQLAATKSAAYAASPGVERLDSAGRPFLVIENNLSHFSTPVPALATPPQQYLITRDQLDLAGNRLLLTNANGNLCFAYDYDALGRTMHEASMEEGEQWTLSDVAGSPLYSWNSQRHQLRVHYDQLHRPLQVFWLDLGAAQPTELMAEAHVYGESAGQPEAQNLRGQRWTDSDQAGLTTYQSYDFKGNLLSRQCQLASWPQNKSTLDWSKAVTLDPTSIFTNSAAFDANNRSIQTTQPDGAICNFSYNVSGQFSASSAVIPPPFGVSGAPSVMTLVSSVAYDAKGQRTSIAYGNGVVSQYVYDRLTFRVVDQVTRRPPSAYPGDCPQPAPTGWPGCQIQSLHYAYDICGRVTSIVDSAQQQIFFLNLRVEPTCAFTYDSIGRLIEATGREHLGQVVTGGVGAPSPPTAQSNLRPSRSSSNDGNAMGRYLERYFYDGVGNLLYLVHQGSNGSTPGWTRSYSYEAPSQLETAKFNNRLTSTAVGSSIEQYVYDDGVAGLRGNMTSMPQLKQMQWDFQNHLTCTAKTAVHNGGAASTTWYAYNSAGARALKVTERQMTASAVQPSRLWLRVYLKGFELYRQFAPDGVTVVLERSINRFADDRSSVVVRISRRTAGTESGNSAPPGLVVRYELYDHLSSVSLELDEDAALASYEEYTPYGGTSYQAVTSATETKRYRYSGKELDEENGLYYYGARYYACWIGRWITADPRGSPYAHRYAYCDCNPTCKTDPAGQAANDGSGDLIDQGPVTIDGQAYEQYSTFAGDFVWQEPILPPDETSPSQSAAAAPAAAEVAPPPAPPPVPSAPDETPEAAPVAPSPSEETTAPGQPADVLTPATAEEAGDAAAEGLAEGLATGLVMEEAIAVGVGIVGAGVMGTVGLLLLPLAIYGVASNWDAISASADRVMSGKGTVSDWKGVGSIGAAVVTMGAGSLTQAESQPSKAAMQRLEEKWGESFSHWVYQLVDDDGEAVYYGLSNKPLLERLPDHAAEMTKSFRGMEIISDEMSLPQAQELETSLIQQARAEGRFLYNIQESSVPPGMPPAYVPPTIQPQATWLNPRLYPRLPGQ